MAWTPLGRQVSMQTARSVDAQSIGVSRTVQGAASAEARVRCGIFPGEIRGQCLRRLPGDGIVRYHHLGGRLHGDGVVLSAARRRHQAQLRPFRHGLEQPAQQHTGIGPALVDLCAGVPPGKPPDRHLQRRAAIGRPGHRQSATSHASACAADGEDPLLFGVHVDELPPPDRRGVQDLRPQHSNLLVRGEDHLQPGVGDRLIVQDRQGHGHRNAVIAAQGGALRPDAAVLHQQVQALSGHVLGAAGLFHTPYPGGPEE